MKNSNKIMLSLKSHFVIAFISRVLFTLYGIYHDNIANSSKENIPKYTDIDYQVFTDAARYVYRVIISSFLF